MTLKDMLNFMRSKRIYLVGDISFGNDCESYIVDCENINYVEILGEMK